MLETCVLVGLDWAEPIMNFSLHVTCSCIVHAYIPFLSHIWYSLLMVFFYLSPSLSLFLSWIVYAWHPSAKLLHPRTLFVTGHHLLILLLFLSGSMMRRPVRTSGRTSPNVAFIRNVAWFYRIFPILLYPLSFIVGVRNLYVRYPWVVPPWSYRSFTPICTVLILLCHGLLLLFEVHV